MLIYILYILCFVTNLLNITEAAEADVSQRSGYFVIGSCSRIPDCNKKCNEMGFHHGRCFEAEHGAPEKACGCYN